MIQFDLFDQGGDSQTGSRQTDIEMLIAEKEPMNNYQIKQNEKRDRLEAAADRAEARSNAAYGRSDMSEKTSGIPFGQPILVGHHSEGRHRAAIKRADNAMRKSVEEDKNAKRLRAKADGIGKGGISSDDPTAISQLEAQIFACKASQDLMREGNKIVRRYLKKGYCAEYQAEMEKLRPGMREDQARGILEPDFAGRPGFPSYAMSNNNANIKRMEKRVEALKAASEREQVEIAKEGFKVVQNVEENRLQFVFDGKPSEAVRKIMKSNGFRWAPSQEAWQRQLTNNAIWSGKRAMAEIEAAA
jgi:hypothetical protein